MLSRYLSSTCGVRVAISLRVACRPFSTSSSGASSPPLLPDLPSLLANHGPHFPEYLSEDVTITSHLFQKSLQLLIKQQKYSAVLDIHNALPALHRLVIPTHDLTFAAMCACSGIKRPLKVRRPPFKCNLSTTQHTTSHTTIVLCLCDSTPRF
jgi:hypothetical protein